MVESSPVYTFHTFIIVCFCSISCALWGQGDITLNTGNLLSSDFTDIGSVTFSNQETVDGKVFRFVNFSTLLSESSRLSLESSGIKILNYIDDKVYLLEIPSSSNLAVLSTENAIGLAPINGILKIDPRIQSNNIPEWAYEEEKIKVIIQKYNGISANAISNGISGATSEETTIFEQDIIMTQLTLAEITALSDQPWVKYIEVGPHPDQPEDIAGQNLQNANLLRHNYPDNLNFDGTGVKVMVRDDGDVGPHIDFEGRIINFASSGAGTHGDGVAGVMAGAGNLNPEYEAAASASDIYVLNYNSTFTDNTIALHQSDNVVLTNSSYSNGCNAGYTTTTERVDDQMRDNPKLLHVFSAGNSNGNDCGYGAGTQWGNITGGHKVGKNVIATANLNANGTLLSHSSRGPAHDGRIKPDLSAHGQGQISTDPNNTYQSFGGTSAAAPTLVSSLAQLYHVYKSENFGNDPDAALIKMIAMNTAEDLGNVGPDFKFGWGLIDAYRAYQALKNRTYATGSITNGGTFNYNIPVPSNVAEVKIMVYWTDPSGAVQSTKALVNDLDITVTDPGNNVHLPYILNTAPNATTLDSPATKGVDDLNNVEQVSIISPASGNHQLQVSGTKVPMGPQAFYLTWTYFYDEIKVTYPYGGEGLVPGESTYIHWEAYGENGDFTIEYSANNGGSWTQLGSASPSSRLFLWQVPSVAIDEGLIRVTRGANSDQSDAKFAIMDQPDITVNDLCVGGANISWASVDGATEYIVYKLGQKKMEPLDTVSSTSYIDFGNNISDRKWYSVQAVSDDGLKGRRGVAESHTFSSTVACPISDLALRMFTNSECANIITGLNVEVFNQGTSDFNQISLSYQVNNVPIKDTIVMESIASGQSKIINLPVDASDIMQGVNAAKAFLKEQGDEVAANDTIISTFIFDPSSPLVLPFIEGFELLPDTTIIASTRNIGGNVGIHYETDVEGIGRLRTNAGSSFPKSGSRAMTMDVTTNQNYATNYLILTFNLDYYQASTFLKLDFDYMHHGDETESEDKVWIRGSDVDSWLEVYDWGVQKPIPGTYRSVTDIDISAILSAHNQKPSCSFQVRFGQRDNFQASSISLSDGLTVDNVQIRESTCTFVKAVCKTSVNVYVDQSGNGHFLGHSADSSSLGCGPFSYMVNGMSSESFSCSQIGSPQPAKVMVLNVNGYKDSCETIVQVLDTLSLDQSCKSDTIYLDYGADYTLVPSDVFEAGRLECNGLNYVSHLDRTVSCDDLDSVYQVEVTFRDANQSAHNCMTTITVMDSIAPTVFCKVSNVSLDNNGNYSIQESDVLQGVIDNCSSTDVNVTFDVSQLECKDVGETILVNVTATDKSNNSSSCLSVVQVSEFANCVDTASQCKDVAYITLELLGSKQLLISDVYDASHLTSDSLYFADSHSGILDCAHFVSDRLDTLVHMMSRDGLDFKCRTEIVVSNLNVCAAANCDSTNMNVSNSMLDQLNVQKFRARMMIESNAKLDNFNAYQFTSGNEIILHPDFEVPMNTLFIAEIESCP